MTANEYINVSELFCLLGRLFRLDVCCCVCLFCLCLLLRVCRVYVLLPLLCDVLFCWASTLLLCSNGCLCLFALFLFGFLLLLLGS